MPFKLILLFLFLGTNVRHGLLQRFDHNQKSQIEKGSNAGEPLVNPKYVKQAERAIQNFLTRLGGSVSRPITLRETSSTNGSLDNTICEVCQTIRMKLMEFAEAAGLINTVQRYKRTQGIYSNSGGWFPEALLQTSLVLHDLGGMGDEVWTSIDRYFQGHNATLTTKKKQGLDGTNRFRFLSTIDDLAEFSETLSKCLNSTKGKSRAFFKASRAVAKLAKHTPASTLNTFRSYLDRTFVDDLPDPSFNRWHVLYCSLTNHATDAVIHDCILEMQRLEKCLSAPKSRSLEKNDDQVKFLREWFARIQDFSNCTAEIDENGLLHIRYHSKHKAPRSYARRIKSIYESLLGRKIPKRAPLSRAANDLGNVLSRSAWGRQLCDEVYCYLCIYQDGIRKVKALSRNARRGDRKAAARYFRVSESVQLYKKGLLLKTFKSIDKVHRTALGFEKYIINGIKIAMNETWQSHIRILSCLSDWMTKILEMNTCYDKPDNTPMEIPSTRPTMPNSEDTEEDWDNSANNKYVSHGIKEVALPRNQELKKAADKSFRRLISSMNQVTVRTTHQKSTLGSLANNLLLTTMFIETIGFISTLFSFEDGRKDEMQSSEIKDDWQTRIPRSVLSEELVDTDEAEEKKSLLRRIYKEIFLAFDHRDKFEGLTIAVDYNSITDSYGKIFSNLTIAPVVRNDNNELH